MLYEKFNLQLSYLSEKSLLKFRDLIGLELASLYPSEGRCTVDPKDCVNCPHDNYCSYLSQMYIKIDCEIDSR